MSLTYGILAFLDPFLFTYIAYKLSVSGLYLGMLSAAWSISYILCSKLLNGLADNGHNKLLLAISILLISICIPMVNNLNPLTSAMIYVLHSISMASMNLSLSVTLLECIENERWESATAFQRSISSIARGAMLLIAALFRNMLTIENIIVIAILFSVLSLLTTPPIVFTFERDMFKFYRSLRSLSTYLKASASLMFIDKPKVAVSIFERFGNRDQSIPVLRTIIAILMVTAQGDYIFMILPYVLKNIVNLQGMWIAYGIAAIFSGLVVSAMSNIEESNKWVASGLILVRGLILVTGFNYVRSVAALTLYIIISSSLFLLIDVVLYNCFVEGSAGFNTSTYFVSRELGSIVGSMLGGMIIDLGNNIYLTTSLIIGIIPMILLMV